MKQFGHIDERELGKMKDAAAELKLEINGLDERTKAFAETGITSSESIQAQIAALEGLSTAYNLTAQETDQVNESIERLQEQLSGTPETSWLADLGAAFKSFGQRAVSSLANAFTQMVTGTQSMADKMRNLVKALVLDLITMLAKIALAKAALGIFSLFTGGVPAVIGAGIVSGGLGGGLGGGGTVIASESFLDIASRAQPRDNRQTNTEADLSDPFAESNRPIFRPVINNYITEEAVAAAIQSAAGEEAISNVIRFNKEEAGDLEDVFNG